MSASHVNVSKLETETEETDPVIAKLQKTGCLENHYAVLVEYRLENLKDQ